MHTNSVGYVGIAITVYIYHIMRSSILLGKMSNLLGESIFFQNPFFASR